MRVHLSVSFFYKSATTKDAANWIKRKAIDPS